MIFDQQGSANIECIIKKSTRGMSSSELNRTRWPQRQMIIIENEPLLYNITIINLRLPQIRATNFIHLGSKIVTLGSKNYFFWAAKLFIWAANLNGKGSRFYRDWQPFLFKWAANIFNEIIFYIPGVSKKCYHFSKFKFSKVVTFF